MFDRSGYNVKVPAVLRLTYTTLFVLGWDVANLTLAFIRTLYIGALSVDT